LRPEAFVLRSRLLLASVVLLLVGGLIGTPAGAFSAAAEQSADAPRADADSSEYYFPAGDGVTMLHADVLRPKGMAADVKTPVIMTVSPYTNHNGSTTDVDPTGTGPNPRFYDFLDMSGALTKGYTFVYVDLPGFGGSGGCNDWGGAREQDAVRAGVEWAAAQPWSNGKVALLGKSYDGWTGLMGIAQQPKGLAAVVALEPVYSGYRYLWMNGVRRSSTNPATIAIFQAVDAKPGRVTDDPKYLVNSAPQAWCYGVNLGGAAADDSETGPYWAERDLVRTAVGKRTPIFMTQGFLETNTHADAAFEYWNNLSGTDNHAWFGQNDHSRCWERNHSTSTPSGNNTRWQWGRDGQVCISEIMRFLDEHLKGEASPVKDPTVSVQDINGRWREEQSWPPADSRMYTTSLRTGTYADDGSGSGLTPSQPAGVWSISEPLAHDAWLAGEPRIAIGVDSVPNANVAANLYDIDEEGRARMISRGVAVARGVGSKTVNINMYGQDWPIPAGHRLGVLVSDANTDVFTHAATRGTVTVRHATISLPFLSRNRTRFLEEDGTQPRLENYLKATRTALPASFLTANLATFALPDPLQAP
jgi:predicted acyl esterase